jgi:hypothetical protein
MPRFAALLATFTLIFVTGASAFAQAPETTRIRGAIVSFNGGVLTVAGVATTYKIALPEAATVTWIEKSSLANIGANSFIGTVAVPQPDGSLRAVEVQLFPEALRGRGEGTRPWDTVPNSSMTNGTVDTIASASVDKIDGRVMVIKYKDEEKKLFVPANVPVITYAPADKDALTPGAHVIIAAAMKTPDGSFTANGVSVGKDGLVPPM